MRRSLLAALLGSSFAWTSVHGEQAPVAGSQPAADASLRYEVVGVQGKVRIGNVGADPTTDEGWNPVKVGDLLGAGLLVHVPMRGGIKLVARPAEPPTVLSVESGTLLSIADLHLRNNVATSRIKLAYGAVRAGVAEGGTRSDMEIEAPTATLSKKGTDIFRIESHGSKFLISLSEQGRGLLQAIQTQSTGYTNYDRSRFVTPGQYVTQRMAMAVDNIVFDRRVNITDAFGLMGNEELFTLLNSRGFGFLIPNGAFTGAFQVQPWQLDQAQGFNQFQRSTAQALNSLVGQLPRINTGQSSGDFGIGQGSLPSVVAQQRKIAQRSVKAVRALGRGMTR